MPRVVTRLPADAAVVASLLEARRDIVIEEAAGDGRFTAAVGPLKRYERRVEVDGDTVTQTVDFRLAIPYWGWLFRIPFRRSVGRPPGPKPPWWAPPQPLDARAAQVLGSLAAISVVLGYLNTLFTQTITFAGDEFGVGTGGQGVAGSVVRLGGFLALVVVILADRRGRRQVLLAATFAGCALALTGAVAPSLPWLTASQTVARGFATALLLLVGIVAAEEVPARCRAYVVGLLAMAGGVGVGVAAFALRLADLGESGWRLLYVIPALALPAVVGIRRHLPESRRFLAPHPDVDVVGHGRRLWLLAGTGLLINLFIAPQSQFASRFLRTEQGFDAAGIGVFSLLTGAPGGIGIMVGGKIADLRGRRIVAAVALVFGTLCTVAFFLSGGWAVWFWPALGNLISTASIPALGVYGPELFPTSLRGRANGIISICALAGSALGLALAGLLADEFGRLGPAMALLAVGPIAVAVLVLVAYPETAGQELEDLNPEDRPVDDRAPP